jgi:hypothetical protein
MDYAKMRAIAEEQAEYADHLEGSWSVEIGPAGPIPARYGKAGNDAG